MKRINPIQVVLFAFLLLMVGQAATAQQRRPAYRNGTRTPPNRGRVTETEGPKHLIKINPLSLFTLTGNLSYEYVFAENMSAQVGVQYSPGITYKGFHLDGYAVTPEFRYYFSPTAPKGFYVAPYLRYRRNALTGDVNVKIEGYEQTVDGKLAINGFTGGVVIGGQTMLGKHVTFGGFIGPNFSGYSFRASEGTTKADYNVPGGFGTIWFRTGMTLGVAF